MFTSQLQMVLNCSLNLKRCVVLPHFRTVKIILYSVKSQLTAGVCAQLHNSFGTLLEGQFKVLQDGHLLLHTTVQVESLYCKQLLNYALQKGSYFILNYCPRTSIVGRPYKFLFMIIKQCYNYLSVQNYDFQYHHVNNQVRLPLISR